MKTFPGPTQSLGIRIVLLRWDRQLEVYLVAFEGPDVPWAQNSQLLL